MVGRWIIGRCWIPNCHMRVRTPEQMVSRMHQENMYTPSYSRSRWILTYRSRSRRRRCWPLWYRYSVVYIGDFLWYSNQLLFNWYAHLIIFALTPNPLIQYLQCLLRYLPLSLLRPSSFIVVCRPRLPLRAVPVGWLVRKETPRRSVWRSKCLAVVLLMKYIEWSNW